MDIVASIPVRVNRLESLSALVEPLRERIHRRAYENFVARGFVGGHDLEDWVNAERELIVEAAAEVRCNAVDVFIDVILPEIELGNVSVYAGPAQLVIWSDPNKDGRQILELVALPSTISLDSVDAERDRNTIRITAAMSELYALQRATA